MKKNLFFLLALAVFALVGCEDPNPGPDPNPGEEEITSIRFEYDTVQISMDDVRGVKLILFPTVEATFTTSDSTIVTVDSVGRVYPVAEGTAAITATYNELVAECIITVVGSQLDLVKWTALELFGLNESPLSNEITKVELMDGSFVACNLHLGTYYLLDNGLYVGTDGRLNGAGYIAMVDMPVLVINDNNYEQGAYNGYYVGTAVFEILPEAYKHWYPDSVSCGLGGSILNFEDYATFMDEYYYQGKYDEDTTGLAAAAAKYIAAIEGTFICYLDMNQGGLQTVDLGMILGGTIVSADINGDGVDDFEYQLATEWFDGYYGLALDDDDNIIKPYTYISIPKTYVVWDLMSALQGGGASVAPRAHKMANIRSIKPQKTVQELPTTMRVVR